MQLASTTAKSFSHTGLSANTTYNYRISSFDGATPVNHSAWTAELSIKTLVSGPTLTASSLVTTSVYQISYSGVPTFIRVFLDTDRLATTGYVTNGIGANFLIENGFLYRYSGSAGGWGWTMVRSLATTVAAGKKTYTVLRSDLGTTKAIKIFGQIDPPVSNTILIDQNLP